MFFLTKAFHNINKNVRQLSTGADIIYKSLLKHNVTDTFIYSGGSIMPLIDKFYQSQINYYINTHEQNCGHAATGLVRL